MTNLDFAGFNFTPIGPGSHRFTLLRTGWEKIFAIGFLLDVCCILSDYKRRIGTAEFIIGNGRCLKANRDDFESVCSIEKAQRREIASIGLENR